MQKQLAVEREREKEQVTEIEDAVDNLAVTLEVRVHIAVSEVLLQVFLSFLDIFNTDCCYLRQTVYSNPRQVGSMLF